MNKLNAIAVYCGSSVGSDELFAEEARNLGALFAKENIDLIYGGAKRGLMGIIADEALAQGSTVKGIIPHFLATKEIVHSSLTELFMVDNMHERKAKMYELSDGFIAMPGGMGTFEELFEMLTWGQLGLHKKPIGILNVDGYYDHLILQLDHMAAKGLLRKTHREMLLVSDSCIELLSLMRSYEAKIDAHWLKNIDKT